MSTISYDGQSFLIDGRRIWLVSGAIHYCRTPHQLWRQRLRAAREAGLNCIETYVFWNLHEPKPGKFDFTGDLDLRRFVQMIGEEGMYCILRPGPYVCAEWDFGGLPAWLHRAFDGEPLRIRQSSPVFQEACARYIGAVMEQVRDLQITQPGDRVATAGVGVNKPGAPAGGYNGGGGGPIVLVQVENEWFCHNPAEGDGYLRELVRYLRENGCDVPLNNCNNLWQPIEGTINTWNGARNLATDMRQLAVVQPDAPRLVTEYWPGWFDMWGGEHSRVDPQLHLYRTAGILATGSQFNFYMFHGGTNFGFWGGRTVSATGCYMTTSYDYDAPLLEAGGRGRKYELTKRISTFASHFGHVFAHLDGRVHPVAAAPNEGDHPLSVVHLTGAQGDVVFLLKSAKDRTAETQLMLSNGLTLPVPLGDERATWIVLNANLGGAGLLNYSNLSPFAFIDRRMLVLFGPADATGMLSIDESQIQVRVPGERAGNTPVVERHDDLTLVVLNHAQVDRAYVFKDGLAIGAAGLDDAGQPIPARGGELVIVPLEGKVTSTKAKSTRLPAAPRLGAWSYAGLESFIQGTDPSFKSIDGPQSLEALECDYGYGWYRLGLGGKGFSGVVHAPEAGDRLHVYSNGKLQNLLGFAPGAVEEPVNLKLGPQVVVLADNLGRFNYGQGMGEAKGLFGHLYEVKRVKLSKPKVAQERAADPFALSGYVSHRRKGDLPLGDALTWKVKPAGSKPMILDIRSRELRGVWLINGEPFALYMGDEQGGWARYVLRPGERGFTAGTNELKLSLFGPLDAKVDLDNAIRLYQTTTNVTERAQWAFSPWRPPEASAFGAMPKSLSPQPSWFRGTFKVSSTSAPLWFEPRGMTKGQLYLNGHNVGRYFVATHKGKAVPPQERYYLPEPWLKTDGENELLIFDEHGASPVKSRLVYDPMGPYNG